MSKLRTAFEAFVIISKMINALILTKLEVRRKRIPKERELTEEDFIQAMVATGQWTRGDAALEWEKAISLGGHYYGLTSFYGLKPRKVKGVIMSLKLFRFGGAISIHKPEKGLTQYQLDRQNQVDNTIYGLLTELGNVLSVEWNIEYIGLVRDAAQRVIVDRLHLMTEQEFYPHI